jgi:hypothetical protein
VAGGDRCWWVATVLQDRGLAGLRGRIPVGWWWQRPSCSFNVLWYEGAFHMLGVQGAEVSVLPGALPHPRVSPASQQGPWFTELMQSASVSWSPLSMWCRFGLLNLSLLEAIAWSDTIWTRTYQHYFKVVLDGKNLRKKSNIEILVLTNYFSNYHFNFTF